MNTHNMKWPKLLVLVRHAQSEGNVRSAAERAQYEVASHDYALTPLGRKQAEITGSYLREKYGVFDHHFISYYRRTRETMNILFPKAKPFEDPRLAEAQRGIWHTMTKEQVAARFPEEINRREREGFYHYRPFGGENWPDIELRIHSFLETLSRDCAGKKILMVVHGHWLILLDRILRHTSIEDTVKRYYGAGEVKNASVTVFKCQGKKGRGKSQQLVLAEENIVPWKDKL